MPRYTAVNTLPQPRLENVTAPTVPANLSFVNISPTGVESPSEVGTTAPAPSVVQANTAGGNRVLLGLGVMGGMTLVWVGVGVVDGLSG